MTDTRGDGFPNSAHLNASDRQAFRNWFTYIAESAFQSPQPPAGMTDCAGLVRYAFREALCLHDTLWRREFGRPIHLASSDVRAWNYPNGPLRVNLFRVRPGRFQLRDLRDGSFRQFADAHALWAYNTVFVSRTPDAARQGDLLFFFQRGQKEPYHVMIYLRRSYYFPHLHSAFVVYDTGDLGNGHSEIRMTPLSVLDRFPDPRWRPLVSNAHFLGFYRWKILSRR